MSNLMALFLISKTNPSFHELSFLKDLGYTWCESITLSESRGWECDYGKSIVIISFRSNLEMSLSSLRSFHMINTRMIPWSLP